MENRLKNYPNTSYQDIFYRYVFNKTIKLMQMKQSILCSDCECLNQAYTELICAKCIKSYKRALGIYKKE